MSVATIYEPEWNKTPNWFTKNWVFVQSQSVCRHKNHLPGLICMYIPSGGVYRHTCPACGHVTEVKGSEITY